MIPILPDSKVDVAKQYADAIFSSIFKLSLEFKDNEERSRFLKLVAEQTAFLAKEADEYIKWWAAKQQKVYDG